LNDSVDLGSCTFASQHLRAMEGRKGAETKNLMNEHLLQNHTIPHNGVVPEWKLNAARAPWWGGFYERMMTLIKDRMARCSHSPW
jgi:hypothetical protein